MLARGATAFAADVVAAFSEAGAEAEVRFAEGDGVQHALAAALSLPGLRVVIAGGDGTLMRLLPVILRAGKPVALLPLGTVNLLGKDLGFTGDLAHDARLAVGDEKRQVNLALAGDVYFHSNAGVGILGRMAREREEARRRFPFSRVLGFIWAAMRTLLLARPISVALEIERDRRHIEADAVLVTNNAFDDAPCGVPNSMRGCLRCILSLREPCAIASPSPLQSCAGNGAAIARCKPCVAARCGWSGGIGPARASRWMANCCVFVARSRCGRQTGRSRSMVAGQIHWNSAAAACCPDACPF